jgi:hypothetical protein
MAAADVNTSSSFPSSCLTKTLQVLFEVLSVMAKTPLGKAVAKKAD